MTRDFGIETSSYPQFGVPAENAWSATSHGHTIMDYQYFFGFQFKNENSNSKYNWYFVKKLMWNMVENGVKHHNPNPTPKIRTN
jgi:hypothetical protein